MGITGFRTGRMDMLRLARLVFPGCLILLTVFAAQAARREDPVPPGVDPAADAALRKMGRSLAAAREFSFQSNTMFDQLLENGQKVQLGKTVNIRIRRPDAISAQVRGDVEDMDYAYNGTKLTVFNRGQNFYAVQDVPN